MGCLLLGLEGVELLLLGRGRGSTLVQTAEARSSLLAEASEWLCGGSCRLSCRERIVLALRIEELGKGIIGTYPAQEPLAAELEPGQRGLEGFGQ